MLWIGEYTRYNWWVLIVAVRFLRHWVMSTVVLFVRHKDANCRKVIWADDRLFTKQTRDKLSTLRIRVAVSFNMSKKSEHVSSLSTRRGSRDSVDEVLSDAYFTVHGTTYTTRRDATRRRLTDWDVVSSDADPYSSVRYSIRQLAAYVIYENLPHKIYCCGQLLWATVTWVSISWVMLTWWEYWYFLYDYVMTCQPMMSQNFHPSNNNNKALSCQQGAGLIVLSFCKQDN